MGLKISRKSLAAGQGLVSVQVWMRSVWRYVMRRNLMLSRRREAATEQGEKEGMVSQLKENLVGNGSKVQNVSEGKCGVFNCVSCLRDKIR